MLKIYIYWHKCWCNGCGTDGTSEDRATQLLICEPLSFAMFINKLERWPNFLLWKADVQVLSLPLPYFLDVSIKIFKIYVGLGWGLHYKDVFFLSLVDLTGGRSIRVNSQEQSRANFIDFSKMPSVELKLSQMISHENQPPNKCLLVYLTLDIMSKHTHVPRRPSFQTPI